jgi:DNA invertase Pin-like site-specific DNA recombinase
MSFAQLERAMIRERTRAALNVKRSRGERISGLDGPTLTECLQVAIPAR